MNYEIEAIFLDVGNTLRLVMEICDLLVDTSGAALWATAEMTEILQARKITCKILNIIV
ncbi:MAG: hypothetical protein JW726_17970 [Anaerolineales bacterium]|nr:hypothetical protein [Anaerolineales bacterium]